MTKNHIRNTGISILFAAFLLYALILHYSPIGIAITAVAIGAIVLTAFACHKEQYVVEKFDVYLLIAFLCSIALRYQELIECFTTELFTHKISNIAAIQIYSLIGGVTLYLVFNKVSQKRKTLIMKTITKAVGMFLFALGLSGFCWGTLYLSNVTVLCFVFIFFGALSLCQANHSSDLNLKGRPLKIGIVLAVLSIILSVFFPSFRITYYKLSAYLSIRAFPWYMITLLIAVFCVIIGLGLHLGKGLIDKDTIFLSGLIGLILVAKAAMYYYFQLSWVAICIYAVLFISFANRFVKRSASGEQTYVHLGLSNNEANWILIAALGMIVSVYLIHIGYVYFWISLLVGVPLVLFLQNIATGWRRDAIFWISILFCIAFSACMISAQNGFSPQKIVFIAAMLVFTSVVMLMLNYKNQVGRNKFKGGKVVIVLFFALLSTALAYKAGSHAKVRIEPESAKVGTFVSERADVQITVTPDGKENSIKNVQYVWTDSFLFDEGNVIAIQRTFFTIPIENRHLIIWAEDANGVISRADYWFDDVDCENINGANVFRSPGH